MLHWMKSAKVAVTAGVMLGLLIVWVGFHLVTHRHTGILRAAAAAKQLLASASGSLQAEGLKQRAPGGSHHSVILTWKGSTSSGARYNVYRHGLSGGLTRLNAEPLSSTTYTDNSVQPGQTYFYSTRAVKSGPESSPSNEVRVDIPSP